MLVAPEIPTNTGNIIRLCANAGAALHLVEPLGFSLDDRALRRAGLDYHDLTSVHVHASLEECRAALAGRRWFALSSASETRYDRIQFRIDDVLVFGAERAGLTSSQIDQLPLTEALFIPMQAENRSLNLANAVAVVVYEAWRQLNFAGGTERLTTSESLLSPEF